MFPCTKPSKRTFFHYEPWKCGEISNAVVVISFIQWMFTSRVIYWPVNRSIVDRLWKKKILKSTGQIHKGKELKKGNRICSRFEKYCLFFRGIFTNLGATTNKKKKQRRAENLVRKNFKIVNRPVIKFLSISQKKNVCGTELWKCVIVQGWKTFFG